MTGGYETLTEKEKDTLRLLLGGHDAKSMARQLGLSVHTIHERLRDARRKMGTSSSREAARMLREAERQPTELLGDKPIGAAGVAMPVQARSHPARGPGTRRRTGWIVGGLAMMISLALLALLAPVGGANAPTQAPPATVSAQSPAVDAALHWLALVDKEDWTGAFAEAGQSFRQNNKQEGWTAAATGVRARYGSTSGRSLISSEWVPSPPNGNRIVKFRTMTSKQGLVIETLSLADEGGVWRVVGIVID